MIFTVIGGDLRMDRLCGMLLADGHEVRSFALENANCEAQRTKSVYGAAKGCDCIILPLPVCARDGYLNSVLSNTEHCIYDIFSEIPGGALVCGGLIGKNVKAMAAEREIRLVDYLCREEMAVSNAAVAAEGALSLIMEEMPITVWGCNVLVIGFGRLGKLLAHRLRGIGAMVTVSARSYGDMAWIDAYGYRGLCTDALEGEMGCFDVIVNTVPHPVLGEKLLGEIKSDSLCLDLASRPGGLDFRAAAGMGVRAIWALSLPGQVAPLTSGEIIRDTIYNIMAEQEQL